MSEYLRVVRALVAKDVLLERKSGQTLVATGAFSLLVVVLFHFAFEVRGGEEARFFPGALWIALIFAGTLGMTRAAQAEEVDGVGQGLALVPVDRSALFVAKLLYHFLLLAVVEALVVPVFAAAFGIGAVGRTDVTVLGLFLGTWGFAALGTLVVGASGGERGFALIVPLVLFPLLVPVALGGVEIVAAGLAGEIRPDTRAWIQVLAVFDVLFTALPALFYEYVVE